LYSADLSLVATVGGHVTEYLKVADAVVSASAGTSITTGGTATLTDIATRHSVNATTGAVTHLTTGSSYIGTTLLTNATEFVSAANASNGRGDAIVTGAANIANNSPRYVTTYWTWN